MMIIPWWESSVFSDANDASETATSRRVTLLLTSASCKILLASNNVEILAVIFDFALKISQTTTQTRAPVSGCILKGPHQGTKSLAFCFIRRFVGCKFACFWNENWMNAFDVLFLILD